MYHDFVNYVISYWMKITELYRTEIETVYEIFKKDTVCQVMVSLIDRVFSDQTVGVGEAWTR